MKQETLVIYPRSSSVKETYHIKYEHQKAFSKKKIVEEEDYCKYFTDYYFQVKYPDNHEEIIPYHKTSFAPDFIPKYKKNKYVKVDTDASAIVGIASLLDNMKAYSYLTKPYTVISDELVETVDDSGFPHFISKKEESANKIQYQEALQSLINKLQAQKYVVDIKTLALFMNLKLDKLILMRTKK
jgi:hypothetical protein